MAGYTRQSVADIIASAVVKAAPLNAEYNAIRDAFALAGGHKHDGSSSEGAYVPLIADVDARNKVVVDTANNRIGIYTEVGGTAVEQVRIQDGAIVPVTDDDVDLGASGAEFKNLFIDGIGYIDSVVVTGGTIDGTTIGATTPAAADFTTVDTTGNTTVGGTLGVTGASTFTGTTTHATVDINGGAIDGTTIGASSAAAGSFTTVSTSGQATLASADINGGTIDGAVIGGTTAQAITGTTITANTGFTGDVTGDLTGNVTGNVTGDITGDISGDVTGNVNASSGTSTFNNVTVNGTLDVTGTTIANVTDPVNAQDAATKNYVDTQVSNLVDSAPAALDTLNELAAALGDDADFSTTVTNSIATKLPLAGGTMSGAIAMGANKVTGVGNPTSAQDAATKTYVDTADALKLNLSGGTLTGNLTMGSNKVTSTATPTADSDLTRKAYVDSILGSATGAATSAAAAATSETNAATSETNAGNSATAAAASASAAATSETNAANSASAAAASAASINPDNIDINGGTIDGTVIGGTTPAAISGTTGQFGTSLNVDGTVTADGLTVGSPSGDADIKLTTSGSGSTASDGLLLRLNTSGSEAYLWNLENGLLSLGTNNTERMRIDSSGHAIIPAGVTLGTSVGVYNAANTLDDYEEGTWTPSVEGTTVTGVGTYSGRSGKYTKVGNLVTVFGRYNLTAHTGLGNLRISGLPFTAANVSELYTIGQWSANNLTYDASAVQAYVFSALNDTKLYVSQLVSGGSNLPVVLDASHAAWFSISYYV